MIRNFLNILLVLLFVALYFSIRHDQAVAEAEFRNSSDSESGLNISSGNQSSGNTGGYRYVDPYITRTGKYIKGHIRKPVSTDPDVYKNRARSRYYYQTHRHTISERRKKKD